MSDSQNQNWLVRPTTIKLLWRVFIAILALTVLAQLVIKVKGCLLYTSPSPRDLSTSRMPSSA